ncbi:GntR family transcriptional regulator [Klebsiella pneumoniae]|uniref:GntR family transcriptional regulator n=1 Tax=Klebsiella pneumoniae TaxID=573 RepID=UPI0009BB64E0|nr:GntR family transcriptional regulator [Klebsiella pneumoniae]
MMTDKTPPVSLSDKIARDIVRKLADDAAPQDLHLVKQSLAEEFNVSRSPVETALARLAADGILEKRQHRGYFLKVGMRELHCWLDDNSISEPTHSLSFMLLNDFVNKRLSGEFSEKELARQYSLTKGQVTNTLRELLQEGWVERKLGYGWAFLPIVTTLHSNAQSYRFRQSIECAAILDEEFYPDETIFRQLREEQEALLDGMLYKINNVALFQIGSHFHESIAACCKNPFYYDALVRVNKLRRLYERSSTIKAENFESLCREHLQIVNYLDNGDIAHAAELMRKHLGNVISMKQSKLLGPNVVGTGNDTKIVLHF